MAQSAENQQTVFIVDDDTAVAESIGRLLRSVDLRHRAFSNGNEFLRHYSPDHRGCVILDIRMPGMGGLELQQHLAGVGCNLPVIFVTGHADVQVAVDAMRRGAFSLVEKPFRAQELLDRIAEALKEDELRHRRVHEVQEATDRIACLTDREREVLELIVAGNGNKAIANELNLSPRTVEAHRARLMGKLGTNSVAGLVRLYLSGSP